MYAYSRNLRADRLPARFDAGCVQIGCAHIIEHVIRIATLEQRTEYVVCIVDPDDVIAVRYAIEQVFTVLIGDSRRYDRVADRS